MTYESQWRATYEDTKNHQEKLRKNLNRLISENQCIQGDAERDEMFELLDDSTFGLGEKKVNLRIQDRKTIVVDDFQMFVRCLFDYEKDVVDAGFFFDVTGKYLDYDIEIRILWKQIKNNLYGVFPDALSAAVRMSKEQKSGFGDSDIEEAAGFGEKKKS